MTELPFTPAPPRRYHPKRRAAATTTTLTLVSATYVVGESVTLTFDRAIDLADVRVDQMRLNDATAESLYSGSDAYAEGADAVRVTLSYEGDALAAGLWLTAPATVLIRPADGGPAWAGVSHLALPFG